MGDLAPRFGDLVENGWASEANPTRVGFFVREGRRTGRMNRGRYFEVTDGAGKFWELPVDRDHKITVRPRADLAQAAEALEALKELLALVEGECPRLLDGDRGGFAGTDERVRAAIAKAEGN